MLTNELQLILKCIRCQNFTTIDKLKEKLQTKNENWSFLSLKKL